MNQVNIDSSDFKALSASTRVKILKLLSNKKYTQSDLADLLNLSIPSVKEHLDILVKSGLVAKLEEGRKWKYYTLTEKTKSLLNSSYYKFVITLGIFVILAGISFINPFKQQSLFIAEKSIGIASEAIIQEPNASISIIPVIALLALILTIYFWFKYKNILRSLPK
ncbi:MAG: winged helix-turn-helix domain-containing protein [Nanoarchaeota archaeon]